MTAKRRLAHDWFEKPLPKGVDIGERSWVYSSFAFLHNRSRRVRPMRIGRDSGIYNGTFFELGPDAEVIIGDYCAIVGAIINTNGRVVIDDYVLIAHEVVIADSDVAKPFHDNDPAAMGKGVHIGENAWIGARAILLGGATIGRGSIVGAGAVVDFTTPDFSIVAGNPARVVGYARSS